MITQRIFVELVGKTEWFLFTKDLSEKYCSEWYNIPYMLFGLSLSFLAGKKNKKNNKYFRVKKVVPK